MKISWSHLGPLFIFFVRRKSHSSQWWGSFPEGRLEKTSVGITGGDPSACHGVLLVVGDVVVDAAPSQPAGKLHIKLSPRSGNDETKRPRRRLFLRPASRRRPSALAEARLFRALSVSDLSQQPPLTHTFGRRSACSPLTVRWCPDHLCLSLPPSAIGRQGTTRRRRQRRRRRRRRSLPPHPRSDQASFPPIFFPWERYSPPTKLPHAAF